MLEKGIFFLNKLTLKIFQIYMSPDLQKPGHIFENFALWYSAYLKPSSVAVSSL